MSAKLLKTHVVLMESINSMVSNLSRRSRNISLELLSARVMARRRLGFLREADVKQASTSLDAQKDVPAARNGKLQRPHVTIISGLSFKMVRPYAIRTMKQLGPLARDSARITQQMYRWATPASLEGASLPEAKPSLLNKQDRPYRCLDLDERRFIAVAARYHKQWMDHVKENYCGTASIVCLFLQKSDEDLEFDIREAFQLYYVSETFSSQAPCEHIESDLSVFIYMCW